MKARLASHHAGLSVLLALSGVAAALALGACGRPASPPAAVVVPAASDGRRPASASPVVANPPPEPSRPACVFTTDAWDNDAALRFSPNARPFALVRYGGHAEVELPVGGAEEGFFLTVDAGGVIVKGNVAAGRAFLVAARAFAVDGVYIPSPSAPLQWRASAPGEITIEVPIDSRVGLRSSGRATQPCGDVMIESSPAFDLDAAVGASRGEAELVSGRSIAIAANRDGRAAAEIDLAPGDSPPVAILEKSAVRSRIAWRLDDGVLVGWVAAADLARPWGGAGGHMVRAPRMHQGRTTLPPPSAITCPGPIPLAAERDGERRAIGTIEPHTIFVLGPSHTGPRAGPHDGYEAVTFLDTPLEPTEGTTLLVPSVELGECGPLRK